MQKVTHLGEFADLFIHLINAGLSMAAKLRQKTSTSLAVPAF
ncbi:MAG: hypothetical protein ACJARL_002742 [Halopseudomonas sp.]|jgi:hypothetical protein